MSFWLELIPVCLLVIWALCFLGRELKKSLLQFSGSGKRGCGTGGCAEKPESARHIVPFRDS